jgi:hypothetical protein
VSSDESFVHTDTVPAHFLQRKFMKQFFISITLKWHITKRRLRRFARVHRLFVDFQSKTRFGSTVTAGNQARLPIKSPWLHGPVCSKWNTGRSKLEFDQVGHPPKVRKILSNDPVEPLCVERPAKFDQSPAHTVLYSFQNAWSFGLRHHEV